MKIIKKIIILVSFFVPFSIYAIENEETLKIKPESVKMNKNILIIVAMQSEADPIISKLKLRDMGKMSHLLRSNYYFGLIKNYNIYLAVNGKKENVDYVGAEATVISSVLGIEKFNPDILINIGTSGALSSKKLMIGDILNISESFYLDRNIPIPEYKIYSEGHFKANLFTKSKREYKVCSSLSFVTKKSINSKMKNLGCDLFDMEAASFSFVATESNRKFYIIKGVTDYVDKEFNYTQFKTNFNMVTLKLADYLHDKLLNTNDL